MKENKGITLVSLVVTIIVLILLAGISINLLLGENGIITKAKEAKENTELAKIEEEIRLNELYTQLENEEALGETSNDAIAKLTEFREKIAVAITNQGVETSVNDTADIMASNIGKIAKGANDVSEWCRIAEIDYNDYKGLESLLTDSEAMEKIMKNSEAFNYLDASDLLILCVCSYKQSIQAVVQNVDLDIIKNSEQWRNAIAKSSTAKAAIMECNDIIKSISVNKNISTTSNAGANCSTSGTVSFTIPDSNILIIRASISSTGTGYSYSGATTKLYINEQVILTSIGSGSGLNVTNNIGHSNSTYPTIADKITTAYSYLEVHACGPCNNNSTVTIYYI